ncbi:MAG: signal peptidase I [Lachnospiraceae bacterium]|jgi:signal peptidase I|nr:signal peptidase I [Lachnospiraceae bacterium]MCI9305428.1 signal peptidase I [Lachnospiraceae bacterium]
MDKEVKESPKEILEGRLERIQRRREWRHFLLEAAVLVAAVYIIFHYVIGVAFVSGHSMAPTLEDGELVLFYRLDQEYQKNDIVIVKRENEVFYIKRIMASTGSKVTLDEEGMIAIDKERQEATLPLEDGIALPYEVPEGAYFLLGDNRENSKDSRRFGAVSKDEIVGRVFLHLGLVR